MSGRSQEPFGLDAALRPVIAEIVRDEVAKAVAEISRHDEYLSPAAAASVASVAPGTIRRWIRDGKIDSHHAGRNVRVSRKDLLAFMRGERKSDPTMTPEQLAARDYGIG